MRIYFNLVGVGTYYDEIKEALGDTLYVSIDHLASAAVELLAPSPIDNPIVITPCQMANTKGDSLVSRDD